ncbi:MAG: flavodoxin family protein [Lachnospiraceae bacterium]|nr:flavodoxin family protein [Lachnospiraceae bacterium]
MMRVLILMGSPRLHGNTAELCRPFIEELEAGGAEVRYVTLADKDIAPCRGCYACQQVAGEYGCVQKDDMYAVVEDIIRSDLIVLATPIYEWYCTAQMKNMLDRHYGLNKFYGSAEGSLWAGKKVAIIATHGYPGAYATDPFEEGIRRLCKHSRLEYVGLYSVRDTDNLASFRTAEAVEGARAFARKMLEPERQGRGQSEVGEN